jgi:cell division protein ZapA
MSVGTQIQIFGQSYHIQGGSDPTQTREAAEVVDQKMGMIASQLRSPDGYGIAVLAALHLADEYISIRRKLEALEEQVESKSRHIAELLDEIEADSSYPAAS